MPQGLQRHHQERDGKQPHQAQRLATGILPDGLVKEGRPRPHTQRPKNTTTFPYRKKRYRPISNRFSSRRMYRPYLRIRGKPNRRPTMYPMPSPTMAPAAAASTTTTMLI